MKVEEIINALKDMPDDQKHEHLLYWQIFLEEAYNQDCAYSKGDYVFIGVPMSKHLVALIDSDLITQDVMYAPVPEDTPNDIYNSVVVMYEMSNNEGWPIITMGVPSAYIPENNRDWLFDYLINLYEKQHFNTNNFDDTLDIE